MNSIVTAKWLSENLTNTKLVILCAGLKPPTIDTISIPNTTYFDIKNVFSDLKNDFPNTFPPVNQFQQECQKIGINTDSTIVVYDEKGIYSSARVWWLFKTMGHQNVAVLDGGLPLWIQQNYRTTTGYQTQHQKGDFTATLDASVVKNHDFIKNNLDTQTHCVVDARSADRFNSIVPEPRAGLRSGNIPNSKNIPYQEVLHHGQLKSNDELKTVFNNIQTNKPLVFSCGSGITACILALAYHQFSDNKTAIYDGSWTEWGTIESA